MFGAVVVIEILRRQQLQLAQPLRLEQRRAIRRHQLLIVIPDAMQLSLALEQHVAQPAEVIEAEVVVAAHARGQAERVGGVFEHLQRRVADANQARIGFLVHRLRDDADRVGEVDHPRARREARDHAAVFDDRRDRADRHRKAGGADGFLADDVVRERGGFVFRALRGAADADAGDDESAPSIAASGVDARRDRARRAPSARRGRR